MAYQVVNGVQCNTTVCCHGYLSGNREINMMMIMIMMMMMMTTDAKSDPCQNAG